MKAKCFCQTHGRLPLEDIIIKNGTPICRKCASPLEFADVKPRDVKTKK